MPETVDTVFATLPGERTAGTVLHLTSLPGPHGIGDIGDAARAFVDTLVSMKLGVWQFLPTGPTACGDSPYQPLSAFAGNEMLLGIDPLVRQGLLRAEEAGTLGALARDRVDYARLLPAKQALLQTAAARFAGVADAALKAEFEAFLHRHEDRWLADYAAYRILKQRHGGRPWTDWRPCYLHREPAAMQKLAGGDREAGERIRIMQFLFDRQWRSLKRYAAERGVRLFGDMPIYVALDSAEAWARPEMLLIDRDGRPRFVSGVPPDYFSAAGQLWGNPLYDWGHHAATGYRWWIERMRRAMENSDLVRIDHFRGFESFWAVPFGAGSARDGEWLPGPRDQLFDALRGALGALPVVAEDLGAITAEVESLRRRHGFPGMSVLQFAVEDPDFDLTDIGEDRVCYTGTHDNDTTAGWFSGGDRRSKEAVLRTRENALRATGGAPATIHLDMIRLAFNSPARLAIAPLQDFLGLGSEARLNTPGTTAGNWRWRVRGSQLSPGFCESVAALVEETGRA